MAPFPEEVAVAPVQESPEYSILKQRVDLDVDFAGRSLKGSTEITVQPLAKDLKQIKLHCRQCKPTGIQAGGITAKWDYDDPYWASRMPEKSDVHQHGMLKAKVQQSLQPTPHPELLVALPPRLKIQELQGDFTGLTQDNFAANTQKQENDTAALTAETPTLQSAQQQGPQFAPIKLFIEFEVPSFRDGIHWIGYAEGDRRYPCMYTKAEPSPGNTSCIFPCVDDTTSRSSWEISIRSPRTLGDAYRVPKPSQDAPSAAAESAGDEDVEMANGIDTAGTTESANGLPREEYLIDLAEDEAAMDLTVVCTGDLVDDVTDPDDETRHTVTFNLTQPVAARHIGFAIGPFEHVDLSRTRDSEEEERLGQTAVKVDGYCMPGKSKDVYNTCLPIPWAIDNMAIKYGSFPFTSFQILFIDDFKYDTMATAGLSFCNSCLLFPKTIIEPMYRNTRNLVRTLADQWMGVNVIAKTPADEWVVAGIAGFMTDAYMKDLCGNNEFRWQQKLAAEKVYDLDVDRPSISSLGALLHLDESIRDFVNVKAALVLFILDRRLMKTTGQTGVQRIINKIFLNAKTGQIVNGEVSTSEFKKTCEKLGHNKLDSFFQQWVHHSGAPIFYVTQRFNKKKLVVEMTIVQRQLERVTKPPFDPSNFMREVKEHVQEVWAPETNPVFTGPMTIRIHEADGTPYEHIVEIKEATTRLEIPYNTKYKRLKRSRRQKERQMAEDAVEGGEEFSLKSLGDKFQSEEEMNEWNLIDWTEEDEEKMGQESYEWIRMDADFEWIGKMHLVMPLYMYVSQLQQDRDIAAQYDSMKFLVSSNPHHVTLSILVRTLMDEKYFWGIREMAADGIAVCAQNSLGNIAEFHLMKAFRTLFCIDDTKMPKSNDFSDRRNFILQCAIPKAMAQLRNEQGQVPMNARQFFVDLLKFNDNSHNTIDDGDVERLNYSDNHYVATLMKCLADSLVASHREPQPKYTFSFGDEEDMEPEETPDTEFEKLAIAQIERHRRIDEWDPSYHNLYSVTALGCLQQLTKAGIVKDKTKELMQYVRIGNADNVRLAAWRCLSEVGVLKKMTAMRYLLHCLSEDPSPHFRNGLLGIFGEGLGHIALGDPEPPKEAPAPAADGGLVIEQEDEAKAKRLEATRKTTPEGAIIELKATLENENVFQQALWAAATSPDITIDETAALCDIAALIYDSIDSLTVALRLPRMWRCEHMGQAKVKFIPHGPYRVAPRKELGLHDWQNLQGLGMEYHGPLSAEVRQQQREAEDAQRQAEVREQMEEVQQRLLEAQAQALAQNAQSAVEMPPPPPQATPAAEKTGFKLSLGAKRKQSMDLSAEQKPGSPKAPRLSGQQTPTGSVESPRGKGSPAGHQRRSSTPVSRPAAKKSYNVVLKLGKNAGKAQDILSSSSQLGRGSTPVQAQVQASSSILPNLPQSSAFPATTLLSPTNSMNYFETTASTQPSLGSFRSYGFPPDADESTQIKRESFDAAESPVNGVAANGGSSPEESKHDMPPPPKPKLKLNFKSAGKPGGQGSPE